MQEYQTVGGNILQLVEMGPGNGILLKQIIQVRVFSFPSIDNHNNKIF